MSGNTLSRPKMKKVTEIELTNEQLKLKWSVSAMQGWTKYMEDRSATVNDIGKGPYKGCAFLAIFDGHGGKHAAQLCSEHLLDHIVNKSIIKSLITTDNNDNENDVVDDDDIEDYLEFIRNINESNDDNGNNNNKKNGNEGGEGEEEGEESMDITKNESDNNNNNNSDDSSLSSSSSEVTTSAQSTTTTTANSSNNKNTQDDDNEQQQIMSSSSHHQLSPQQSRQLAILKNALKNAVNFIKTSSSSSAENDDNYGKNLRIAKSICRGFLSMDDYLRRTPPPPTQPAQEPSSSARLSNETEETDHNINKDDGDEDGGDNTNKNANNNNGDDQEYRQQLAAAAASEPDKSGTTAVCALISDGYIFIANCGDSRAILSYKADDDDCFSTKDHKPSSAIEKSRIMAAGCVVVSNRVNGVLALSRALGDFDYKTADDRGPSEQAVSPLPDVSVLKRTGNEELLILACDGVWDVIENEQLIMYTRYLMRCTPTLQQVANKILDTCLYKPSRDNLTVIVVAFDGVAPTYDEQFAAVEQQRDRDFEQIIDDILATREPKIEAIHELAGAIDDMHLDWLPPGGGLAAKRAIIIRKFNAYMQIEEQKSDDSETDEQMTKRR